MQRLTFDPYCCDNANSILAALGVPGRPRDKVLMNDMEASFHSVTNALNPKYLCARTGDMSKILTMWNDG